MFSSILDEINISIIAELFMISSHCIRAVGFACQFINEATSDPQLIVYNTEKRFIYNMYHIIFSTFSWTF